MADRPRPKVAMIGLDAAELSFIQQHLLSLPTLRQILESGTLHHLASTAGVFPGSVWPTFYGGMHPGDHGIYHHLQWDSAAMQLRRVAEDWLYVEPFWYELERRKLRVATIDVPMSFPSRLAQGAEIINWGSHDELGPFRAHPKSLAAQIRSRFGHHHPMGCEIPVRKSRDQLERVRRNLIAGARLKGELSLWMLAQGEWDFFLTVFGETHRGGHLLWPEEGEEGATPPDGLLDVYRAVDQSLGTLLDAVSGEGTTVIVFALHGMGRNDSQEHFMPRVMDRVNAGFMGKCAVLDSKNGGDSVTGQHGVLRTLRESLPAGLQNAIARAVPVAVRDMVVSRQISEGHDWGRTPGIALLADLNGYLRWNLQGRERRGMLQPGGEAAEDYIAWVRQCLLGLRASDVGVPLVREMLLSREHFPGRRTDLLPDAVVTWNGLPPISRVDSQGIGSLTAEAATGRAGNHRSDGFCVVLEGTGKPALRVPPPSHISDLSNFVNDKIGQAVSS